MLVCVLFEWKQKIMNFVLFEIVILTLPWKLRCSTQAYRASCLLILDGLWCVQAKQRAREAELDAKDAKRREEAAAVRFIYIHAFIYYLFILFAV